MAQTDQIAIKIACSDVRAIELQTPSPMSPMLRVLFFHTDDVAANVRIRPLLETLLSSRQIRHATVDRNMALSGARSDEYDVPFQECPGLPS